MSNKGAAEDGKRFIINIGFGADNEPRDIFIGANGEDYLITRGKDVTVTRTVIEVLDNAIIGVPEKDPNDDTKTVVVDRKRFPYTLVGTAEAKPAAKAAA